MYQETFDFYDSTSIKIYNLDKKNKIWTFYLR